ncbi:MAG: tRNA lysidine(34) synthetase TilS [bacterium]|nr:tRNA lysidine(34) synthetase TilS [bacterium]
MLELLDKHLEKTQLLPPKSKLVVAVSGGVDSVVLLDLLSKLQASYGWQINVAHLDHKVRDSSAKDAFLVARLSDKYGHEFYLGQLNNKSDDEASLRESRYNFLNSVLKGTDSDLIVLGHHSDDRLETSIFNLIRGSDRAGIGALKEKRDNIVRPLIGFSKGQIIIYANSNNLSYNEDLTNESLDYSRNLIRSELTPFASVLQAGFKEDFLNKLDQIEQLNLRIDWLLPQVYAKISKENEDFIEIDLDSFLKFSKIVQTNLIAYALKKLKSDISLTKDVINRALSILNASGNGKNYDLISGLKLIRTYDKFIIAFDGQEDTSPFASGVKVLSLNKAVEISNFRISLRRGFSDIKHDHCLIQPTKLYIRNWQTGDRIHPVGTYGSKKIQDIFVDKKIPKAKRQNWPVIVDSNNQLVWLPKLVRDRRFISRENEPSYQIICEMI